jgi:hypothetical protein
VPLFFSWKIFPSASLHPDAISFDSWTSKLCPVDETLAYPILAMILPAHYVSFNLKIYKT